MCDPKFARAQFEQYGISISEWARQRGFSASLVYQILAGKRVPQRGQSHQIAVALGIKSGEIGNIGDIESNLAKFKEGVTEKTN